VRAAHEEATRRKEIDELLGLGAIAAHHREAEALHQAQGLIAQVFGRAECAGVALHAAEVGARRGHLFALGRVSVLAQPVELVDALVAGDAVFPEHLEQRALTGDLYIARAYAGGDLREAKDALVGLRVAILVAVVAQPGIVVVGMGRAAARGEIHADPVVEELIAGRGVVVASAHG